MSQITIYIEPKLEKKMSHTIKKAGISKSRWLSNLIRKECDNNWPSEVRNLVGAWSDFPTLEEIRSKTGKEAPRELF